MKKGKIIFWNGFMVCCDRDVIIAPLKDNLKVEGIPAVVRKTIPVFFDKKGLAFVPSLDYKREKTDITGTIQKKE